MASVNKVIIIGNLGRDPEVRYTTDGRAIASFSVATSRNYVNKATNQTVEETEWHRVVFFGRIAEICKQYLRKGSSIYVEGRLRTRQWEKDGQTHYTTEIMGENMQMLGARGTGASAGAPADDYAGQDVGSGDQFDNYARNPSPAPAQSYQPRSSQPSSGASKPTTTTDFGMDEDVPF